ncbi:MAG: hypothetical protein M1834_000820 [Cirrosporium novae-zelandiae]|nr:MAG: hypothetical protein M1834_000820 [Cirrosporium novae-zelandiae]
MEGQIFRRFVLARVLVFVTRRANCDGEYSSQWPSSHLEQSPQYPSMNQSVGTASSNMNMSNSSLNTMNSLGLSTRLPCAPTTSTWCPPNQARMIQRRAYMPQYSENYPNPAVWNTYNVHPPKPPASTSPTPAPKKETLDIGPPLDAGKLALNRLPPGNAYNCVPAFQGKGFGDLDEFPSFDPAFGTDLGLDSLDENAPIFNIANFSGSDKNDALSLDTNLGRRFSSSTYSMSSCGPVADVSDLSAFSEVPSYRSDFTPLSSLNTATPLSAEPSSRYFHQDIMRTTNAPGASPSRNNMRTAPYSLDRTRGKRWPLNSCNTSPSRRDPSISYTPADMPHSLPAFAGRQSSPATPNSNLYPTRSQERRPSITGPTARFQNSLLMPSSFDSSNFFNNIHLLDSNASFKTLHSNADVLDNFDTFGDLTEPPDLFGPLQETPLEPPPEDLNPDNPDLVPHEQDLRFKNDLYTPKWVRGHGNKREGWCGICKPGRWLVLKNSAFWYDKSFSHGVSATTGCSFDGPKETRPMEGSTDVWEGLCGGCGDWVALISSKKKGTTWFRHAYKCHTHTKIKDAPKRRRDNSYSRPASRPKLEPPTPALSNSSTVGEETSSTSSGVNNVSPLQRLSAIM